MLFGADVSEFQGPLSAEWFAQWSYVILRAVNDNGYPDQQFAGNWPNAKGQCVLGRGVYGWPIAGANNHDLGSALVANTPDAEFGYWADYEQPPSRPLASAGELEQYLQGIEDAGGKAGFYSNVYELARTPYLDARPWWAAGYGPNDGQIHPLDPPAPRDYLIHQFTSEGGLDRNVGDDAALRAFAQGGKPTPPRRKARAMFLAQDPLPDADGVPNKVWYCRGGTRTWCSPDMMNSLIAGQVPFVGQVSKSFLTMYAPGSIDAVSVGTVNVVAGLTEAQAAAAVTAGIKAL